MKNLLAFLALGFVFQVPATAAENDHFLETVVTRKAEAGQPALTTKRLCLTDQSLKVGDDIVAVINKVNGQVMADKGKGFVSSSVGTFLKQGDRVITLADSDAEIVFFDCCRTSLKANNLITIAADPGCKAAIVDATKAPAVQQTAAAPAAVHPMSYVPPIVGAAIILHAISYETNGFGSFDHRRGFDN